MAQFWFLGGLMLVAVGIAGAFVSLTLDASVPTEVVAPAVYTPMRQLFP